MISRFSAAIGLDFTFSFQLPIFFFSGNPLLLQLLGLPRLFFAEHQSLPVVGLAPVVADLACHARLFPFTQQVQGLLENVTLLLDVPRLATWATERKIDKQKPRNAAVFDNVLCRSDYDRRNAILFKIATDQAHGLMAYRSDRHHDHGVQFIAPGKI
jgi:hypothetical protein